MIAAHGESTPVSSPPGLPSSNTSTPRSPERKRPHALDGENGGGSPRTRVADRLHDLDIHQSQPATRFQSPRKRLKDDSDTRGTTEERDPDALTSPPTSPPGTVSTAPERPRPAVPKPTEGCAAPKSEAASAPEGGPASPVSSAKTNKRFLSPPPLFQASPVRMADAQFTFPGTEPDASSFDRSMLTWQDSEITGHQLDPTTPDDDGEGINGIGFRPTPAMAYARSQRRRQQVSEWKAREAKEARQRRLEKRRGEETSRAPITTEEKRSVHFTADVQSTSV